MLSKTSSGSVSVVRRNLIFYLPNYYVISVIDLISFDSNLLIDTQLTVAQSSQMNMLSGDEACRENIIREIKRTGMCVRS